MSQDDPATQLVRRARSIVAEIASYFGTSARLTWWILFLGVVIRLGEYAADRPFWLDESALRENVVGRPVFEFDQPLVRDQLAPPGFLVVERVVARILGGSAAALRLVPLLASIAGLFVFRLVAIRMVSPIAVPMALALAAVSDDLIYYASEFKQYSSDLLIALGCTLLAEDLRENPQTLRRSIRAAVLGGLAVWFSHTSVFVLAAGGLGLGIRALMRKSWREVAILVGIGAFWGFNFLACFHLSNRLLGDSDWMWIWWDFAFLPLPPTSIAEVEHVFWSMANVFTNPVSLVTPGGPVVAGLLGLVLFALGCLSALARRDWWALGLWIGPIVLVMAASALHRYPFHGRLLVFLVPSLILPMAEGLAVVRRRFGRVALASLLVFLFFWPVVERINRIDRERYRVFDSHGDQRNDLLDYLEAKRLKPQNPRKPSK